MNDRPPAPSYPTLFGCAAGAGGDVVVIGVPYDRGTDAKPGCANGPMSLRMLSRPEERVDRGELFDLASGKAILSGKTLSDLGDLRHRLHQRDDKAHLDFVAQAIHVVVKEGKKPLILGGDHLVTLSSLRGIAKAGKAFQVVQIDAHHDYASPGIPVCPTHGTFMTFVAEEKLAAQVLQIGVRGWSASVPIAPAGIKQVDVEGLAAALLPNVPVYLTVDTDGFDPSIMPAVSYPIPGGLPFRALEQILTTIQKANVGFIGADWMEYNPTFDTTNQITGTHVISGLLEIIAALTARST